MTPGDQKEHTLACGETIVMECLANGTFEVMCIDKDGTEVRWLKKFTDEDEAVKEYHRFD